MGAKKKKSTSPAKAYAAAVKEIDEGTPRDSAYKPAKAVNLTVKHRHAPRKVSELGTTERAQLGAIHDDLATLLADPENDVEAAEVYDGDGKLRYRLYAWNYGVGYLFPARGLDVVGFGCQHDIEHWSLAQRDLFWAMDRALKKKSHGVQQMLSFCWWRDECWDEIADVEPGTAQSEPYIRKTIEEAKAKARS